MTPSVSNKYFALEGLKRYRYDTALATGQPRAGPAVSTPPGPRHHRVVTAPATP
ncbi:hypothetical protein [Catenulispora yoronensis]|uniref:hypothetical protein n=1 Tax=Catenulispora yoronensis TaxID=450799 RepID=UPI0031D8B52C